MSAFVAIDFETSHYQRDSACAVALVRVEDGRIVAREHRLIRPPRRPWMFTAIHGITRADVEGEPPFPEVWSALRPSWRGAEHFVAHNAPFDRSVLHACCRSSGLTPPPQPFLCTVQEARAAWGIFPTKLPDVCAHLGIALRHHEALSDAEACARIHLAALQVHDARRRPRTGESPAPRP